MMHILSRYLYEPTKEAFHRFPVPAGVSLFCALLGIFLIHLELSQELLPGKLFVTGIIAYPITLALSLFYETSHRSKRTLEGLIFLGILFCVCFLYLLNPHSLDEFPDDQVGRVFPLISLWFLTVVLANSFSAFLKHHAHGVDAFAEYNQRFFWHFVQAAFFTLVLGIGLTVALFSIDALFNLDIPGERFGEMWMCVGFLFGGWYFLSGVPKDIPRIKGDMPYPAYLKIFAQYILLPLIVVYFLILYA